MKTLKSLITRRNIVSCSLMISVTIGAPPIAAQRTNPNARTPVASAHVDAEAKADRIKNRLVLVCSGNLRVFGGNRITEVMGNPPVFRTREYTPPADADRLNNPSYGGFYRFTYSYNFGLHRHFADPKPSYKSKPYWESGDFSYYSSPQATKWYGHANGKSSSKFLIVDMQVYDRIPKVTAVFLGEPPRHFINFPDGRLDGGATSIEAMDLDKFGFSDSAYFIPKSQPFSLQGPTEIDKRFFRRWSEVAEGGQFFSNLAPIDCNDFTFPAVVAAKLLHDLNGAQLINQAYALRGGTNAENNFQFWMLSRFYTPAQIEQIKSQW